MDTYATIQTERQKGLFIYFFKVMYLDVLHFDFIWFDFPHDIFVYIPTFLSKYCSMRFSREQQVWSCIPFTDR